jgi:hypothetical protein
MTRFLAGRLPPGEEERSVLGGRSLPSEREACTFTGRRLPSEVRAFVLGGQRLPGDLERSPGVSAPCPRFFGAFSLPGAGSPWRAAESSNSAATSRGVAARFSFQQDLDVRC